MPIGPIIARELLVNPRRTRMYSTRATLAFALGAAFFGIWKTYKWYYGDILTVQQVGALAAYTFYLFVTIQALITLAMVPELVATSIAQEKERRTLSGLLITHVYSIDVVVGKLIARFLLYLDAMLFCVPVLFLLSVWGGIPPFQIVLSCLGIVSMALFIAGLGTLISTLARSARKATTTTASVTALWLLGPFLVNTIGTFLLPRWLVAVIGPASRWMNASTPLFLLPGLLISAARGRPTTGAILDQFTEMIALQLGMALFFVLAAVWRLRPTYRHQEGGDGRALGFRLRTWNWRILPRRAVGDDPILWRELHTSRSRGIVKLFNLIVRSGLAAGLLYALAKFAIPAMKDVFATGYANSLDAISRNQLNQFVRIILAWIVGVSMVVVAGATATSIPTERDRDTWLSLLATPLSGREILRAKMLAAILRCAPWFAVAVVVATVGLIGGAVSPLALVVACLLAVAATFFAAALGIWLSLSVKVSGNASGSAVGLLLCLSILPPMMGFNPDLRTVLEFATCIPCLIYLTLLSPQQAQWLSAGDADMVSNQIGAGAGESWLRALLAVGLGLLSYTAGAIALYRHACTRFDRVVGRPVRATAARPRRVRATVSQIIAVHPAVPLGATTGESVE